MTAPASLFHTASLPAYCTPTSPYLTKLSSAFNTCVPTPLALLSTSLGISSILAWFFAQLPQIYKNWHLQSASGLSIYFLLEWLAGDVTNLAGALLTGQAGWQVGVATYYVFVDVCLSGQYFWYAHVRAWRKRRKLVVYDQQDGGPDADTERDTLLVCDSTRDHEIAEVPKETHDVSESAPEKPPPPPAYPQTKRDAGGLMEFNEKTPPASTDASSFHHSIPSLSRPLLALSLTTLATVSALPTQPSSSHTPSPSNPPTTTTTAPSIGTLISWTSTFLYLLSRLPQIFKNFSRQSTSGLSPYMFLAAFLGNLFYSAALMTNPLAWASYGPYGGHGWAGEDGSNRETWVWAALPFWLGAAGVLGLDATVGLQFLIYGEGKTKDVLIVQADGDGVGRRKARRGRGRWRRVTGWMRGWVPSPSPGPGPEIVVTEAVEEEGRPLLVRRVTSKGSGSGYGTADASR